MFTSINEFRKHLNEGMMSDLHVIAQESESVQDFKQRARKQYGNINEDDLEEIYSQMEKDTMEEAEQDEAGMRATLDQMDANRRKRNGVSMKDVMKKVGYQSFGYSSEESAEEEKWLNQYPQFKAALGYVDSNEMMGFDVDSTLELYEEDDAVCNKIESVVKSLKADSNEWIEEKTENGPSLRFKEFEEDGVKYFYYTSEFVDGFYTKKEWLNESLNENLQSFNVSQRNETNQNIIDKIYNLENALGNSDVVINWQNAAKTDFYIQEIIDQTAKGHEFEQNKKYYIFLKGINQKTYLELEGYFTYYGNNYVDLQSIDRSSHGYPASYGETIYSATGDPQSGEDNVIVEYNESYFR